MEQLHVTNRIPAFLPLSAALKYAIRLFSRIFFVFLLAKARKGNSLLSSFLPCFLDENTWLPIKPRDLLSSLSSSQHSS